MRRLAFRPALVAETSSPPAAGVCRTSVECPFAHHNDLRLDAHVVLAHR